MNTALIITAIAGLSIGGLSMNNGFVGTMPAPSAVEVRSSLTGIQAKSVSLDLVNPGMLEAIEGIADAFGVELELSPDSRDFISMNSMMKAGSIFQGKFTLEQALVRFERAFKSEWVEMNVSAEDGLVSMKSNRENIQDTIETRVHTVPSGILHAQSIHDYSQSIERLLEVKFNLEYTRIETVNNSIVVAAPPEIHLEVVKLMRELDTLLKAQWDEQRLEAEQLMEKHKAQNQKITETEKRAFEMHQVRLDKTIERVQNEFDDARVVLLQSKHHLREVQAEQSMLHAAANGLVPLDKEKAETGSIDDRLIGIAALIDDLELKVDENEERYTYLRSRLLDSRYTNMFNGLD